MFSDVEFYSTINIAPIYISTYAVPIAYIPPPLILPTVLQYVISKVSSTTTYLVPMLYLVPLLYLEPMFYLGPILYLLPMAIAYTVLSIYVVPIT